MSSDDVGDALEPDAPARSPLADLAAPRHKQKSLIRLQLLIEPGQMRWIQQMAEATNASLNAVIRAVIDAAREDYRMSLREDKAERIAKRKARSDEVKAATRRAEESLVDDPAGADDDDEDEDEDEAPVKINGAAHRSSNSRTKK